MMSIGTTLLKKLLHALEVVQMEREEFEELTNALAKNSIEEWTGLVESWEADNKQKNPFEVTLERKSTCSHSRQVANMVCLAITLQSVRLELATEEKTALRSQDSSLSLHDVSAHAMILQGMEIEDQQ
jgi:hypothetical protein